MDREVPFDEDAICDECGAKGAFDFMGDFFCPQCLKELEDFENKYGSDENTVFSNDTISKD